MSAASTPIIAIAGSPSASSKSSALLGLAAAHLRERGLTIETINVRSLDAEALIAGRADHPQIAAALAQVASVRGLIIATPIYKAAYTGVLKVFLDLLPANALAGKIVLPIGTGATPAHMLALDYGLRPVLMALGTSVVLPSVYLIDGQFVPNDDPSQPPFLTESASSQWLGALSRFADALTAL